MKDEDLISLDVAECRIVASNTACLVAIGDAADVLVERMCQVAAGSSSAARRERLAPPARVVFGLPILTAPFPMLVNSLMTEHNTRLDQLSLFGWIEDHGILEPRAEVLGMTPLGEQPVTFLRDIDLDCPPEAWLRAGQPARWLRVVAVAIASDGAAGEIVRLSGDGAALAALELVLPTPAQPLITRLRDDLEKGLSLRVALRQRRRTADPAVMRACDGWRVLARAAQFIRIDPANAVIDAVEAAVSLDLPRRW